MPNFEEELKPKLVKDIFLKRRLMYIGLRITNLVGSYRSKTLIYLKFELCDLPSESSAELRAEYQSPCYQLSLPTMWYQLKLFSYCSTLHFQKKFNWRLFSQRAKLMWYPNITLFLTLKSTTKGTEPQLCCFIDECCREVGNDGQLFGFPAFVT